MPKNHKIKKTNVSVSAETARNIVGAKSTPATVVVERDPDIYVITRQSGVIVTLDNRIIYSTSGYLSGAVSLAAMAMEKNTKCKKFSIFTAPRWVVKLMKDIERENAAKKALKEQSRKERFGTEPRFEHVTVADLLAD